MTMVADPTYDDKRDSTYIRSALFQALAMVFLTTTGAGAQALKGPDAVASGPEILKATTRAAAPSLEAVPVTGIESRIDGRLDDAAWAAAPLATDFVQLEPDEGQPASERTEVWVLYGHEALFVAFKAFDRDAEVIVGQLTRRDTDSFSDRVHVAVDSYNDSRTAFHFAVNPRGVKQDIYRFDDTQENSGWDAVWDVATDIQADGWSAEFRIPYSQLRFGQASVQDWGINFVRDIARRNETSLWAPISGEDNAIVSKFGKLRGLRGLEPPRRLELKPYSVARVTRSPSDPENPFYSESEGFGSAGLDLKYGVTSNLTLDVVVNPDFGQVEADPAQVNLTAFETFLPEQRPFFIEGANIFSFNIGLGDGDGSQESLFYSRRIGRRPQGEADSEDGFVDAPDNTTILSAAKLSGKTDGGWSIGLLHASTAEETAQVVTGEGAHLAEMVEPLTNYGVARVQRDFREGKTALGLISTMVLRPESAASDLGLHSVAYSAGVDFRHRFWNDNYQVNGYLLGSRVSGTAEVIAETQEAAGRYLDRPDAEHLTFDDTRTTLGGFLAAASFTKNAGGFWRYGTGFQSRSPEFETNDLGYMREADFTVNWVWGAYQHYLPTKHLRRWNVNLNGWTVRSFGGERTGLGGNVNGSLQFSNYWSGYAGINREAEALSTGLLRGGPSFLREPSLNGWAGFSSDDRKAVRFNLNTNWQTRSESDSWRFNTSPNVTWRPSGRANLSLGTLYTKLVEDRQ